MAIISASNGTSIVTAELVRTVWNNYINTMPTFLHAATLHVQELDNIGGAGAFSFIVPNYFSPIYTGADEPFPLWGLADTKYFVANKEVRWDSSNLHGAAYALRQYDRTLLLGDEEYKMDFISGLIRRLILSFELDFTAMLQGITIDESFSTVEITPLWNGIFPILPKGNTVSAVGNLNFETKQFYWYASNSNSIVHSSYEIPALAFMPGISSLGGWILETCSQYAKHLDLKQPKLACSPAVIEAICTEYSMASSTATLIGGEKTYNVSGNAISNGYLTAYTLPGLQVIYDYTGWTMGIIFKVTNVTTNNDNTITLTLQCLTKTANLPADGKFYLSKNVPLVWSMKKYSPAVDASYYDNTQFSFAFGQWLTTNSMDDITVSSGFANGSTISVTINNDQLTLPGLEKFPTCSLIQLQGVTVSTPYRPENFLFITTSTFRNAHTGAVTLHFSYLHDKAATHIFTVKQRDTDGGVESTEIGPNDKIPCRIFERGINTEGYNMIAAQCIMASATVPQLGGQFMAWSAYPSATQIIPPAIAIKKNKDTKNKIFNTKIKYKINLDNRLISYVYDPTDISIMEERKKFIIPVGAEQITLIKDYSKEHPHNDIKDPIVDAIERGLTADKLELSTYQIYKDHFPKEPKALRRKKNVDN